MWKLDHKESSTRKNWCFWTVVLEKTLESPLDCKEIHQPIWKEISPEYALEGLMLKLKLPYFGHLMRRTDSFEKTLNNWRQEEKGMTEHEIWMASLTQWTWVWISSRSWWWTGKPDALQSMGSQRVEHDWATNTFTLISVYVICNIHETRITFFSLYD